MSGYLICSPATNQAPYPPKATLAFWYQWVNSRAPSSAPSLGRRSFWELDAARQRSRRQALAKPLARGF